MEATEQNIKTGMAALRDNQEEDRVAADSSNSSDSEAEHPVDDAIRESWLAAFQSVAGRRRGAGIRPSQLGDALRLAGFVVTEAEVAQYRAEAEGGSAGGGTIGADAFLALADKARREVGGGGVGGFETLCNALAVFDKSLSGRISAGDLRHWLTSLGEPIDEVDVTKMLEHLVDDQGQLDYVELAHRLASL